VDIADMNLDRLRKAVRENRVSFPAQVPVFSRQPRPDIQWRLAELFFIRRWSCVDLAVRYGLSPGYIRLIIARWARRAAILGYLQDLSTGKYPASDRQQEAPPRAATRPQSISFSQIPLGDAVVDLRAKRIIAVGREIELTPTEWRILEDLAAHVNRTVPHQELARLVSSPGAPRAAHCLRHFIRSLRRKLEPAPECPRYFLTAPAVGYGLHVVDTVLARHNRHNVVRQGDR
jgi:DNA-binding winged helix-turn-helix (wHTH) protein